MPVLTSPRRALPAIGLLALAFPALGHAAAPTTASAVAPAASAPASPAPPAPSAAESRAPAVAPGSSAPAVASAAPAAEQGWAKPSAYEQISLTAGPRDVSVLASRTIPVPVFASDLGTTAAYSQDPWTWALTTRPQLTTGVRNTLTNRTTDLGLGAGRLLQVDTAEQIGLFRQDLQTDNAVTSTFRVGRLDGRGPFRTLDIEGQNLNTKVVLSGNGKFVVTVTQEGALRRLNLATGVWTTIEQYAEIGPRYSVSDDGQSIVGLQFDLEAQQINAVVWGPNGVKVLVPKYPFQGGGYEPQLSPDGSTAFTIDPPVYSEDESVPPTEPGIVTHDVATGTSRRTVSAFVENFRDAKPIWISPTGDRVAYALGTQSSLFGPRKPALALNTKTGEWSPFGGVFATSMTSGGGYPETTPTAVSRNGRFAAIAYNRQVALVNLAGRPLLGNLLGFDPLAPASYTVSYGLDWCGFSPLSNGLTASFAQPASWIKPPRRAHVVVGDGRTVLQWADWTKPALAPLDDTPTTDPDSIFVTFPPEAPHTRTLAVDVVDGYGRRSSEKLSANVTCGSPAQ